MDLSGASCTLKCFHVVHTECFMHKMMLDTPNYYNCPECGVPLHISSNNSFHSEYEENYTTITQLYNTNGEIKNCIKAYYKEIKILQKHNNKFETYRKRERKNFIDSIHPLRESIVELQKQKRFELKKSTEYKQVRTQKLRCDIKMRQLIEKLADHNIEYSVGQFNSLEQIEELKNFRKLYQQHKYRFRRFRRYNTFDVHIR
jgi:hypothetical protein